MLSQQCGRLGISHCRFSFSKYHKHMLKKYFNHLRIVGQYNISSTPLDFLISFSELSHYTQRETSADPGSQHQKRECPFHCCYPDLSHPSIIIFSSIPQKSSYHLPIATNFCISREQMINSSDFHIS